MIRIDNALEANDVAKALNIAGKWCKTEPLRTEMQRAYEVFRRPESYVEMGYDIDLVKQTGVKAFCKFYNEQLEKENQQYEASLERKVK